MITIPMTVSCTEVTVPMGVVVSNVCLPVKVGTGGGGDIYHGDYTFIPSEYEQVAYTSGKVVLQDITIAPIPSNWGKITYNGRVITVS